MLKQAKKSEFHRRVSIREFLYKIGESEPDVYF